MSQDQVHHYRFYPYSLCSEKAGHRKPIFHTKRARLMAEIRAGIRTHKASPAANMLGALRERVKPADDGARPHNSTPNG